jgi:PAS domain S-box-containing protein
VPTRQALHPELAPLSAHSVVLRTAIVATACGVAFWLAIVIIGGMPLLDHAIILGLIAAMATAWGLAARGYVAGSAYLTVGSLWLSGATSLLVHGVDTPAIPTLAIAGMLAALMGGVGRAVLLVALTLGVALVAELTPLGVTIRAEPVARSIELLLFAGQFTFVALMALVLASAIRSARAQVSAQYDRHLQVTAELATSQAALSNVEQQRQLLAQAIATSPTAFVIVGTDGRMHFCNEAMARLFGAESQADLTQRTLSEVFAEPLLVLRALAWLSSGDSEPQLLRLTARRQDGTTFAAELLLARLTDEGGDDVGAAGTVLDISERLAAQRSIADSATRLQRTARIGRIGGWEVELDTGQLRWDEEVRRIHGVPPEFTPTVETAISFYTPESQPTITAAFEALVRDRTPFDLELNITSADGREVWVRAQGEPVIEDERVVRVAGTFQDVTERVRLEQQLRQTQRLEGIGRLAGGVAHDFNNLLTAILGYAEDLQPLVPAGRAQEDLAQITAAGEKARDLTSQLLAFARRQMVLPRVFAPGDRLAAQIRLLERVLGEDVAVRVDIEPDAGAIRMDPGQFDQIILNLVVNARDAMPSGGVLDIRLRRAESDIEVVVKDYGTGIPDDVLPHIFEPFFTTKAVGTGTGMGLATVYGIVQQAGGRIRAESIVEYGTTFTVSLPQAIAAAEPEVPTRALAPRGEGEQLLLAEDDPAVRALASRVLRSAGYIVFEADDGVQAQAVASAMREPPALVVTDVVMPGLNGPDLVASLRRRWPSLAVLYVSGYAEDRVALNGTHDTLLQKPYSRQELLAAVRARLTAAVEGASISG